MKRLILNAGSSGQKSCLYDFEQLPVDPLPPLWEGEIDWTVQSGMAAFQVETASGRRSHLKDRTHGASSPIFPCHFHRSCAILKKMRLSPKIIASPTRSLMMLHAKDIMTEAVLTIPASVTVAQAIALMQRQKVRSLIVVCPDEAVEYGIVTERDVVYKVLSTNTDPSTLLVREIMRQPCISVHPAMSIPEVSQLFADTAIQRAPVIEDGTLLGVISVTDLLMKMNVGEQKTVDTLSLRIQEALQHARIVCDQEDQVSRDCAVAWDIVEELQSEASHRRDRNKL
jgi:CBS domain-containing protein